MHSGIVALHEKDYNLSYSYFYEAFDTYNLPIVNRPKLALRALKLMMLSKIMNGKLDEVNSIMYGKNASKYAGKGNDLTAIKSIEEATRKKSVKLLQEVINANRDGILLTYFFLISFNV